MGIAKFFHNCEKCQDRGYFYRYYPGNPLRAKIICDRCSMGQLINFREESANYDQAERIKEIEKKLEELKNQYKKPPN